jgi:TonB family protein
MKTLWAGGIVALLLWCLGPASAQSDPCSSSSSERLIPLMDTHTLPPYPPEAVQRHEQGTTLLRMKIAQDGKPYAAVVEKSSGSSELDAAAQRHVESNWRYNATSCSRNRITHVSVKWNLRASPISYLIPLARMLMGLSLSLLGLLILRRRAVPADSPFAIVQRLSLPTYRLVFRGGAFSLVLIGGVFLINAALMLVRLTWR